MIPVLAWRRTVRVRGSRRDEGAITTSEVVVMRRTVLMITVFALMAASCGDDNGGEAPTKAEWIAAADAICAENNAELALIPEPQTPEEMGEAGTRAVEIQRAGIAKARALIPPEGDEAAVAEILDAAEAVIDWGEGFIAAVASGDLAKAAELEVEGEGLSEEATRLAKEYGLKECHADED